MNASGGEARLREIDADDASRRPTRGHRQAHAAGAAADVEKVAFRRDIGKVKERLGQALRPASKEALVGRAVIGQIARWCWRRHGGHRARNGTAGSNDRTPFKTAPSHKRQIRLNIALRPALRQSECWRERRFWSTQCRLMGWSGRAPAPLAARLTRGAKDKEHAVAETLKTAVAVIGIDIGKNSFNVVGLDRRGAILLRQRWSRG